MNLNPTPPMAHKVIISNGRLIDLHKTDVAETHRRVREQQQTDMMRQFFCNKGKR